MVDVIVGVGGGGGRGGCGWWMIISDHGRGLDAESTNT